MGGPSGSQHRTRAGRAARVVLGVVLAVAALKVVSLLGDCVSGRCAIFRGRSIGSALTRTDPSVLTYRELRAIPTGLRDCRAVTVDGGGRIYVGGDYAIRVFDRNGSGVRDIRTSSKPDCLAVGPDGRIYAGMQDHVEVFTSDGSFIGRWSSLGRRGVITSISADSRGVWAADAGNRVVIRYDLAGRETRRVGAADREKGAPGLVVPSPYVDVAGTPDGSVWVSDPGRHQLELYSPDGRLKRAWGEASFTVRGFSGCCNPTHFAILPDGGFVTSEKGIPRVKVYAPNGRFRSVVAGRESFSPDVRGLDLAVDGQGRVLALDPSRRSVRVFVRKDKAGR